MNEETTIINPDLEIITLLKRNNELLEQILKLQKKEHRAHIWGTVIHVFLTLLPLLIAIGITYYMFTLVNNNIMLIKGNVDTLRDFIVKLVPDFSGVGETLNNAWNDVQFWK